MLVVQGSVHRMARVLKNAKYEVSCINSPFETVLAGLDDDIASWKRQLADADVKETLLKVPYAFHTSQIDPILADFQKVAAGATFFKAKLHILYLLDTGIVAQGYDWFGPVSRPPLPPGGQHAGGSSGRIPLPCFDRYLQHA